MGTYYSLDLGATSLRVLRVELGGTLSKILSHQVESQPISPYLMVGTAEVLWLYVLSEFSFTWNYVFMWKLFPTTFNAGVIWFYCHDAAKFCRKSWRGQAFIWFKKGTWIYFFFSCQTNFSFFRHPHQMDKRICNWRCCKLNLYLHNCSEFSLEFIFWLAFCIW